MNNKFKKIISLILVFAALMSSLMILSSCNSDKTNSDKENSGTSDSNYVSIDCDVIDITIKDEQSVLSALQKISGSLGINDAAKELKVSNVSQMDSDTFYRVQQYYKDIPVYGNNIALGVDENGKAFALTSNTAEIQDVNVTPKIDLDEAEKKLKKFFKEQNPKSISFYSPNELVIYQLDNGEAVLAYDIVMFFSSENNQSNTYECFVNANNGDVIKTLRIDLFDTADASGKDNTGKKREFTVNKKSSSEYILQDETRNINIYDVGKKTLTYEFYDANNKVAHSFSSVDHVEYLSDGNKIQPVSNSKNQWNDRAVTLMANLKDTYDFYYKVLSRKGTNGENNIINGCFNDSMPSAGSHNAYCWWVAGYWQKEVLLTFGTDNSISIDTVGHEYTHGVEMSISGMTYEGESGAIMEAYSDIFGEFVEDYSKDGEMNNDCDWIHGRRNMIDPSKNDYPSEYNGENFETTVNIRNSEGESTNDNGNVHKNNTVISHAAYLMFNGIDGNESMKIDTETLSKIWYRSLYLLQPNAGFQQCADAVYTSAKTLKEQITAEQLECVKKAFENAGIIVSSISTSSALRGSSLYVKDINFEKYGNYHLKIFNMKDLQNPKIVLEKDVTDTNGVVLDFNAGIYTVTVTDNDANGSKDEYSQTVRIIETNSNKDKVPVTIYTNFGGETVSDFTVPTEKVVTLGEISVIEPELTPIDATSYSIKWSSSDESVATVSPNGEAGIVTALAKGTATITAELTSGGKTITKTTNLRVASKARDTVLVLDISGSMSGTPLEEMKKSAIQFCNDLLKDDYNNRVGIVFYDNYISTIELTNDLDTLVSCIKEAGYGGTTDMESGLSAADKMLENESKADAIKNVVIMADGLPNCGQTSYSGAMPSVSYYGYYTDTLYANAVVDTAKQMMTEYNLYSLGFFHSLYGEEKDFATELMKLLTNQADGYHQVDKAEDLQFAFGDISENISLDSKIVINIACPVDVNISYSGETLSSSSSGYCDVTSFGTLQLLGKNKDIKVVSLDSDKDYDIQIVGTGDGKMDYSVNYFDDDEHLSDYRSFESVSITTTTIITSTTDNSGDSIALNIDEDGDGEIDIVWSAAARSKGEIAYDKNPESAETVVEETPEKENKSTPVWAIVLVCVFVFILVGVGVIVAIVCTNKGKNSDENSELEIPENARVDMVMCSICGRVHPSDRPCECRNEENKNKITENAERTSGFIQVTNGSMNGFSVPIKDGETLYLGKDPKYANLVFTSDYRNVSRVHCAVTLDAKSNGYFVTDCSSNGTYLISKKRLIKGRRTPVNINTILILANNDCTVLLG